MTAKLPLGLPYPAQPTKLTFSVLKSSFRPSLRSIYVSMVDCFTAKYCFPPRRLFRATSPPPPLLPGSVK